MSTKYINPGHRRVFTAGAAYNSGDPVVLRSGLTGEMGVAEDAVANGARGVAQVSGVQKLPKLTGSGIAAHAIVYWDDTAKKITTVSTSNTLAGTATQVTVSADTEIELLLNDRPGAATSD